jgi:hypothetical protein
VLYQIGAYLHHSIRALSNLAELTMLKRSSFWWLLLVGVSTALLCAPFMRNLHGLGDEGIWLGGADRLLRGRRLYADFFELQTPLGFLLVAGWLAASDISFISARCLVVLTIVGISCFTYLACFRTSGCRLYAAAIALGWVIMSQGFWTQTNHHWFATLFSMMAVYLSIGAVQSAEPEGRRAFWRAFASGMACGAASMSTQHRGALITIAAAVAFMNLRRRSAGLFPFVFGVAVVPACMLMYIIGQGALVHAFEDIIVFNATQYSAIQSLPFASLVDRQNLPLGVLYPVIVVMVIVVLFRNHRALFDDRLLQLCIGFGVAGFLGSYPRPDIVHIAFAAPLALPLLAYCTIQSTRGWPTTRLCLAVFAVTCFLLLSARAYYHQAAHALRRPDFVTPRGKVGVDGHEELQEVISYIAMTPTTDSYFFYPYMPLLPFLVGREQVSKYDLFMPSYTTAAQYQDACASVMSNATWVVIDRMWTDSAFLLSLFPGIPDAEPQERMAFERALTGGFELVLRMGSFELRRRKEVSDANLCEGIIAR